MAAEAMKSEAMKSMSNQYWRHDGSQQVFAVQVQGSKAIAAKGPLALSEITVDNLERFDYPYSDPFSVDWLNENRGLLTVIEVSREEEATRKARNHQWAKDIYDRADAIAEGRQWITERYKDAKLFLVEFRENQWAGTYVSTVLGEFAFSDEGREQAEQARRRLERTPPRLRERATALAVRLAESYEQAAKGAFVDEF